MAAIDELKLIDGYFDGDRFIMRGIGGNVLEGVYKAEGLTAMASLIHDTEEFNFANKDSVLFVPVESNKQIKKELLLIARELERLV
jgi:hypothetical protein